MTPGWCALCLDGCKSQLYGGPRQGRPETRALALFPASRPDRTTIFRRGDGRGPREESGGTGPAGSAIISDADGEHARPPPAERMRLRRLTRVRSLLFYCNDRLSVDTGQYVVLPGHDSCITEARHNVPDQLTMKTSRQDRIYGLTRTEAGNQ